MTLLAPIGPARVAAIRPVQPGPVDDPSQDGLGVEVVTEPTFVPLTDQVTALESASDLHFNLGQRAYAANATTAVMALGDADPARVRRSDQRGNSAVTTGFDRRPASSLGDVPRGDFATPFARAMGAYAGRTSR